MKNKMKVTFAPLGENERFARLVIAGFMMPLDPTLQEMEDVKTAVSEAVTNCIIHGYECEKEEKEIAMEAEIIDQSLHITVQDWGIGIDDIEKAMQPFYTSKPKLERSGMGFSFMETFMDQVHVESKPLEGTKVCLVKRIGGKA